jgi:hypothetical protein
MHLITFSIFPLDLLAWTISAISKKHAISSLKPFQKVERLLLWESRNRVYRRHLRDETRND